MRLKQIEIKDVPPIKVLNVDNLSDVIVLAGPNGVGKTRLIQRLLHYFQNLSPDSNVHLTIEATCNDEREDWGKDTLDTASQEDIQKLRTTLQKSRRRTKWRSNVINFESDRSIQKITPFKFSFDFPDPWEEKLSWDATFIGLRERFQDTVHSIFRKVQSQRDMIARKAESLRKKGRQRIMLTTTDYPDPVEPFKQAFSQLLAPKKLLDADPKKQNLNYEYDGREFPIESLSSGEREVVNVVFDFLLRSPSDSIVIFDEPDLHLHPELSYKLVQTLKTIGINNQFIFCTHSPDIITSSLDNSVVFIGPPTDESTNQAILVREGDETNRALKLLGQSIGIIALGKKIVLIEGANSSLDKQVYGMILKDRFPNLVLVPSGGKEIITSFAALYNQVLQRTIWGVEFFMLCDRDVIPPSRPLGEVENESKGRLRVLKRYHIENYFLNEDILARIFSRMEPPDSWLISKDKIRTKLKNIARGIISYAVALIVSSHLRDQGGNLDFMPGGCHGKSVDELTQLVTERATSEGGRVSKIIDTPKIEALIQTTFSKLENSLNGDTEDWKFVIPGRPILNTFASNTNLDVGRLKLLYLKEAEQYQPHPFKDVIDIFEHFNSFTS